MMQKISGKLTAAELRRFIAFKASVFWALIFLAWLGYPSENRHSIMTHTFSFLGSYETYHNPRWWWLFSVALCFWGVAMIPPVRYAERCFTAISPRGARVGTRLMLLGCLGIIGVGLFPEGQATLMGNIKTTHGHMAACTLLEIGFGLGIPWHGALLILDRRSGRPSMFNHHRFIVPYCCLLMLAAPILYLLASGAFVFPPMTEADTMAILVAGNPWRQELHTPYSFPFWENLLIGGLFLFLSWFMLALPNAARKASKDLSAGRL